jgi:hypothetical protein
MQPFARAYTPQAAIDNMIAAACARYLDPQNHAETDALMKCADWEPDDVRKVLRHVCQQEASWPTYRNDKYQVCVRPVDPTPPGWPDMICLSIKRIDKEWLHDWRELQAIKNELCGEEFEAVELYPAESRKVDTANQYWLWVIKHPAKFPFGFNERMVTDIPLGKSVQRPFTEDSSNGKPKDPSPRSKTGKPAMTTHTLPRSGRLPLTFTGQLLAEAAGRQDMTRWHNLALYLTTAGQHVLAIDYRTEWRNEPSHAEAVIVAGPAEAEAALLAYDPTAHVQGYPPGSAFAAKQTRLLADIRQRYAEQVSQLLARVPGMCERIA